MKENEKVMCARISGGSEDTKCARISSGSDEVCRELQAARERGSVPKSTFSGRQTREEFLRSKQEKIKRVSGQVRWNCPHNQPGHRKPFHSLSKKKKPSSSSD